jgi:hypothetical protein
MKLILYILIIWFLVRVISRLFMPRVQENRRRNSMLYQIFSQLQNQARNNGPNASSGGNNGSGGGSSHSRTNSSSSRKKNLNDIEEADFEDVTDEEKE